MSLFLCAIFLLHLSSLSTAANFNLVYEWHDEIDYEWPSEASRTKALGDGAFEPEKIEPRFLAVYGTRLFLSLEKHGSNPVSLVSLPTTSTSSAPPKLTPFSSWEENEEENRENCHQIQQARGQEVDSVGRLWVLDNGAKKCNAKLWTIDIANNDETKLIHEFPFHYSMQDLVLDETQNGTYVFITQTEKQLIRVILVDGIVVKDAFVVYIKDMNASSIALSPKAEQRHLYISSSYSNELYSISVAELHSGTKTTTPKRIGKWTGKPYRMLMDNHGTIYSAFLGKNYVSTWKTSQPFAEQKFFEVAEPHSSSLPFSFALDEGTFWLTAIGTNNGKQNYRILKAAVGSKSYIHEDQSEQSILWNITLFGLVFFGLALTFLAISCIVLRQKRINSLLSIRNESHEMVIFQRQAENVM
ncbi:uncharacterized protein LOC135935863 [Cloeon dipterum]|uniref:uncharacterized protein LOC135935863 n=1 Tax=Cloeon dipterum TaxID=197152 RepID=UPI00321FD52E